MKSIFFILLLIQVCLSGCNKENLAKSDKDNIPVMGFYGKYQAELKKYGFPAQYKIQKSNDHWDLSIPLHNAHSRNIAVLFPNSESNDPYWTLVREGIELEAIKNNFKTNILASDSYGNVAQHREQFKRLAATKPDAMIIGSIHYRAMDDLIAKASNGYFGKPIPVIGVVNDLHAPQVAGKVMVSFTDMGKRAGDFVIEHAIANGKEDIRIAFFPGPINSGWAPESLSGFVKAVRDYPSGLDFIEPVWDNPTPIKQRKALEKTLSKYNQIDYIVGNAVAASEAVKLLQTMGQENDITIVSTYFNPAIRTLLEQGKIAAAPSDQPDVLGRIAVSMISSLLSGKKIGKDIPFRVAPNIPIIYGSVSAL